MTNLGAGFPVGSPETAGPPLPSSSGPPSERDRYSIFIFLLILKTNNSSSDSSDSVFGK